MPAPPPAACRAAPRRLWLGAWALLLAYQAPVEVARAAEPRVAARVGPSVISEALVTAQIRRRFAGSSFHRQIPPDKLRKYHAEELAKLIDDELLLLEAARRDIHSTRADVDKLVAEVAAKYGDQEGLAAVVQRAGGTMAQFRDSMVRRATLARIIAVGITQPGTVSRDQAAAHYAANPGAYVKPAVYRLNHLLAKADPAAGKAGRDAARERAVAIAASLRAGLPLDALAARYPTDQFKELGWVHRGSLLSALDQALPTLEVGDVSAPIGTIYGFHLLQLLGKQPPEQLSFAQVADSVIAELSKSARARLRSELLASCRRRWPVWIAPGSGGP